MRVRVFYHDKCFDGACSAALFSRFYRERIRQDVEFAYSGLVHRAGALFDESKFDGDENAIVDFKYSTSPKITWWFDHHLSAFLTPEDAAHYEQQGSTKKFFDPDYRSCTKFIATIAEKRFGFNPAPVAELIEWADIIDGAAYADARTAVEMKQPAMKLTMVIESSQDPTFNPRLIPLLATMPLGEIIQQPFVAELLPPLLKRHEESIRVLRERAECKEGTLYFDVTDKELEGYNKFIPYYLHPNCVYSVGLSKSSFRTKVAVGSNPWARPDNMVNLAKICERYGGGGHARVGAISFEPDRFDQARQAAAEIVAELRATYRASPNGGPAK
ncbi:MAG: phosphoesterase [Terriglobales bacterium]